MKHYLVVKVLDSNSLVTSMTEVYQNVELRSYKSDMKHEIKIFEQSAKLNSYDYKSIEMHSRICAFIQAEDDALLKADSLFSELLDLKSIDFPISCLSVTNVGFIKNIASGIYTPIKRDSFNMSTSFITRHTSTHRYDFIHVVQNQDSELAKRYIKAMHWFRHAKHETNKQLRILFHWFALEALLKEGDNDNIIPVVRWFLGFPNGKKQENMDPNILSLLRQNNDYMF